MQDEDEDEINHPPLIMSGHYSDDSKHLRDRLTKLETQLRQKTDRYLHSGECMSLILDARRYETVKVEQYAQVVKSMRVGK